MPEDSFVHVEDLHHDYAGQRALAGVSFAIQRGEVLGLLGPNGAGKSTTLRILSGVLRPDRGSVSIDAIDLASQPLSYKSRLGYLPDTPPLYPELSVDEYLRFCTQLRGVPARQSRIRIVETKERCGLQNSGKRLIGSLSRGFQQRVGLAQAIAHDPALIVLDEPTLGLDPLQIREIRALIGNLARECSVLLSSHQLSEVRAVCHRVQIIDQGKTVINETVAALESASPRLRLRFSTAPGVAELERLAGPDSVEDLGGGAFLVTQPTEHDVTASIVETSVHRGWGLVELTTQRTTLEDVFLGLVTGEHPVSS